MGAPLPSRIPWMVLRDWAEVHRIDADNFLLLDQALWEMDTVFIESWKASISKGDKSPSEQPDDKIKRWMESE